MALRATSTNSNAASATATGNRPAGTADGDTLLMSVEHSSSGASVSTPPSGWTRIDSGIQPGDMSHAFYWKVASSEPATWDTVWSASGAVRVDVAAYSGRHASAPIDVSDSDDLAGGTNNDISTSITSTVAGCDLVGFVSADVSSSRSFSNDLGWTEEIEDDFNKMHTYMIRLENQAVATYTPTVTVSGSAQHMGMFLVALAPAAAGGGGQPVRTMHQHRQRRV